MENAIDSAHYGQRKVLETLALGAPLEQVLNSLIHVVEPLTRGMLCSIMLADPEGKTLLLGSAPSLPPAYLASIDGKQIGPVAGACGTAAFLKSTVFTEDIQADPLWAAFRHLPLKYNLRACWSSPILATDGRLLGTFAMYYHEVRRPTEEEVRLISDSTHLAAIAIEHAQTRERLGRTLSLLDATVESTADGLLVMDLAGRVVRLNGRFAAFWPSSRDEDALTSLLRALKTPDQFLLKCCPARALAELEFHETLECQDGRVFEAYSVAQRLGGAVVGQVWSFRDMTERRRTEIAMQAAVLAKTQFLANVSHEIRTPLGAVLGFSELLTTTDPGAADRAEWGARIQSNGLHLLRLVNEILDLSKAEFSGLTVTQEEVSIAGLVADLYATFSPLAQEKDLGFEIENTLTAPLLSDRARLRQILTNVIGNAVKFTNFGKVKVAVGYDAKIKCLHFLVVDTGIGFDRAMAAQIFEPFSQLDPSHTRRFGGAGLGLTLSRLLAKALGGDVILVESSPGVGSQFRVSVSAPPVLNARALAEPARADSKVYLDLPSLDGTRVLLVDDSVDNRVLMSCILERAGAEVQIAENGEEGVEKAMASNYDVVLMDVQMPVMDGYQATRTLRSFGYPGPIVAVTAHAMRHEQERTLSNGCNAFMSKPVSRELLVKMVHRYVSA